MIKIKYKSKDSLARTLFHHTIFGKLNYADYRGKKYGYYRKGYLHDIPFFKNRNGEVCFRDEDMNDERQKEIQELLELFCEFSIVKEDDIYPDIIFVTGDVYMERIAKGNGAIIRRGKKKRTK